MAQYKHRILLLFKIIIKKMGGGSFRKGWGSGKGEFALIP